MSEHFCGLCDGCIQSGCICPGNECESPCDCAEAPDVMPFREQLTALTQDMTYQERIAFHAGVRFVQGFAEYGDSLFKLTDEDLEYEIDCEQADEFVYQAERKRRRLARQREEMQEVAS